MDCFEKTVLVRFTNKFPKKFLKMAKIKLLDCGNIYKYTSFYQAIYNHIYSFTTKNSKLSIKAAGIFLQITIFFNISIIYTRIILAIELK